jgi:hypothetical protein
VIRTTTLRERLFQQEQDLTREKAPAYVEAIYDT